MQGCPAATATVSQKLPHYCVPTSQEPLLLPAAKGGVEIIIFFYATPTHPTPSSRHTSMHPPTKHPPHTHHSCIRPSTFSPARRHSGENYQLPTHPPVLLYLCCRHGRRQGPPDLGYQCQGFGLFNPRLLGSLSSGCGARTPVREARQLGLVWCHHVAFQGAPPLPPQGVVVHGSSYAMAQSYNVDGSWCTVGG